MARTYQLMLIAGFVPPDIDLAWDALQAILRADEPCDPLITAFRRKVALRYPDAAINIDDDEDSEEEAEDCEASLNFTFGVRHVRASIVSVDEKGDAQDLTVFALQEGMVVFDLVTDQIHRPGGFGGLVMAVEDRPKLFGPRLDEVLDVVSTLTPAGGPSFMVVERGRNDYVQIAGGDGHYVFEWCEPTEHGFRHWVAGYPDESVTGVISIMTNGYHVPVRSNENLSASDVKSLFEAFMTGCHRPEAFRWRDMTDDIIGWNRRH